MGFALLRGKHFSHRCCNRPRSDFAFFAADDKWWRQQDVIAICSVHATLRRISKHALIHGSLKDFSGDVFFSRKWCTRGFIFYEFNTRQQAEAAHVASVVMLFQRLKRCKKIATRWLRS